MPEEQFRPIMGDRQRGIARENGGMCTAPIDASDHYNAVYLTPEQYAAAGTTNVGNCGLYDGQVDPISADEEGVVKVSLDFARTISDIQKLQFGQQDELANVKIQCVEMMNTYNDQFHRMRERDRAKEVELQKIRLFCSAHNQVIMQQNQQISHLMQRLEVLEQERRQQPLEQPEMQEQQQRQLERPRERQILPAAPQATHLHQQKRQLGEDRQGLQQREVEPSKKQKTNERDVLTGWRLQETLGTLSRRQRLLNDRQANTAAKSHLMPLNNSLSFEDLQHKILTIRRRSEDQRNLRQGVAPSQPESVPEHLQEQADMAIGHAQQQPTLAGARMLLPRRPADMGDNDVLKPSTSGNSHEENAHVNGGVQKGAAQKSDDKKNAALTSKEKDNVANVSSASALKQLAKAAVAAMPVSILRSGGLTAGVQPSSANRQHTAETRQKQKSAMQPPMVKKRTELLSSLSNDQPELD